VLNRVTTYRSSEVSLVPLSMNWTLTVSSYFVPLTVAQPVMASKVMPAASRFRSSRDSRCGLAVCRLRPVDGRMTVFARRPNSFARNIFTMISVAA
jgi:hypothetical protein